MATNNFRKPIRNFFIKKDVQMRLIRKIVLAVFIATVTCVATILVLYLLLYQSTFFYRVTLGPDPSIGDRQNILSIIIPGLFLSSFVNVIIGVCIGLYASRKYAIPLFKLERWASLLINGHLNTELHFREKTEMQELCNACNSLTTNFRNHFLAIKGYIDEIRAGILSGESVALQNIDKIDALLDTLKLDSGVIEVSTKYITTLPATPRSEEEQQDSRMEGQ